MFTPYATLIRETIKMLLQLPSKNSGQSSRAFANPNEKSSIRWSSLAPAAVMLLAVVGTSLYTQGQSQSETPAPVRSRADETLAMWNGIGNKLIAMARDFPEDKYGFKLQKDQRTFAETLLHVDGVDYLLMRTVSGSNVGPNLGKDLINPSREVYKTKAEVVKLLQQAVVDGGAVIQQQGDAGLDKTSKFPFGNRLVHNSYNWMVVIEDSGEHYGQLAAYYRANNLVPPASRR